MKKMMLIPLSLTFLLGPLAQAEDAQADEQVTKAIPKCICSQPINLPGFGKNAQLYNCNCQGTQCVITAGRATHSNSDLRLGLSCDHKSGTK